MNKINIIIADDHALFAEGMRALLNTETSIEISFIVSNGKELLMVLGKIPADMVLLDINMPELNGLEAARQIRKWLPQIKLIMLSTYNDEHLIKKAIEYGVHGYLLKTTDKEDLIFYIHEVMNGNKCFPDFIKKKKENVFDSKDIFLKQYNLTKREFEILQLIKQAFSNQQMAEKLFLSIYTVETHRKNIMQKLSLKSPAGLMKFISENNI